MVILRTVVVLICAAVFATVSPQATGADDPEFAPDYNDDSELVPSAWDYETFKAHWSVDGETHTQRCIAWLRRPYRPIGNNPVIGRGKVTCPVHWIDSTSKYEFYLSGPSCNKNTNGPKGFRQEHWNQRKDGSYVYPLKFMCDDPDGIQTYTDYLHVWNIQVIHLTDPDWRAELLLTGLA